ncbi:MAG TPA: hypothetical protein VJZ27_19825, partial [Aggregatilineales bacterium]|nr:hypothetical protein [Aggregatilineales bacterium]
MVKKPHQFIVALFGLILLSLLAVGEAAADCVDGTAAGETLVCDTNPGGADQTVEGLGGDDNITVTSAVTDGAISGDGDGTGTLLPGDGGNDVITNNGTVVAIGGDVIVNGNGGND